MARPWVIVVLSIVGVAALAITITLGVLWSERQNEPMSTSYLLETSETPTPPLVFVTAYIGRTLSARTYNNSRAPQLPTDKHPCLAFTSRETEDACGFGSAAKSRGWKVVYIDEIKGTHGESDVDNFNLSAKQPKICPHKYPEIMQSGAKFMVWCDHKYVPNYRTAETVTASWPHGAALMMAKHPIHHLNGAMSEIELALEQPRYAKFKDVMLDYVNTKERDGWSKFYTPHLTATSIYWKLDSADATAFQNEWWKNIEECGIEDQVSLSYAAQKFPASVALFPGKFDVGHNNLFSRSYVSLNWIDVQNRKHKRK